MRRRVKENIDIHKGLIKEWLADKQQFVWRERRKPGRKKGWKKVNVDVDTSGIES